MARNFDFPRGFSLRVVSENGFSRGLVKSCLLKGKFCDSFFFLLLEALGLLVKSLGLGLLNCDLQVIASGSLGLYSDDFKGRSLFVALDNEFGVGGLLAYFGIGSLSVVVDDRGL